MIRRAVLAPPHHAVSRMVGDRERFDETSPTPRAPMPYIFKSDSPDLFLMSFDHAAWTELTTLSGSGT